jgi:hypothetical protein
VTTRYELDCVDCPFRTTVVGEFAEVFEAVDSHRADQEADPVAHFVNIYRRPVTSQDGD